MIFLVDEFQLGVILFSYCSLFVSFFYSLSILQMKRKENMVLKLSECTYGGVIVVERVYSSYHQTTRTLFSSFDFSFFLCFYFDCCRIPLLWYKHFSFFDVKIRLFRFQKPKHLTVSVCDGTKLNKYINKSVCIEAKRVDGIKKRQVNA